MFKNLSDNLNLLMAKARLNSSELARLTDVPATTIKRIRNNEQSNPTVATLLPIASHFSISITELLACETHVSVNAALNKKINTLPLLSWRECAHYDLLDYEKFPRKVRTECHVTERAYALLVNESDNTFFPDKCLLIVDPAINPQSGDYVIVSKADQSLAKIRKYLVDIDNIYLKSLVDEANLISFTPDYLILGVIVQYKVELKSEE